MKSPLHEIITDGRTVWVNSPEVCLGRFGPNGVDVHNDTAGQMAGHQCLDCRPGDPDWEAFKTAMLKHHGITVAESHKPGWVV